MADLYLVEFKGHRREYFFNTYYHDIDVKDHVIIQAERGEDAGIVKQQLKKGSGVDTGGKPRSILRPASEEDVVKIKELRAKELENKKEVIRTIRQHGLIMKVVDVELQYDGNKMTVFFTADHRVDFRSLVKELASNYRTRIEMRQIGVRDEARRIGGYGICGKEQCCSSFLMEFKPISTADARVQDLPLNPSKISGNCGRLLCCLKYEAALYTESKKKFPNPGKFVQTANGNGFIERIDYFREEAIIRNEEGNIIRATSEQITGVEQRTRKAEYKDASDYETVSDEELKKLDESDNAN